MKPWELQNELKKEKIPSINDVILAANEIENPRNKALLILTYLTAGRICELVRYRRIRNKQEIEYPSIRRKDLLITTKAARSVLLITLRNEKHKSKKTKDIPIPLDKDENLRLLEPIQDYLNGLSLEEELFPFGYKNALKILSKVGTNPHFLRHIRLTHLVTIYDYNEQELKMYAGWTDGRPSKHYIEMRWGDLLKKL